MARSDWWHGLGELARDVLRVMFVYALVLQTLAPLAVARASPGEHATICSTMTGAGVVDPADAPPRIVHDCLVCCVGSVVADLALPTELPEPTSFSRLPESGATTDLVRPAVAGGPPPQRAPPGVA